jgi:hypothetical protein
MAPHGASMYKWLDLTKKKQDQNKLIGQNGFVCLTKMIIDWI